MAFSKLPKASELRAWASSRGYSLLINTGDGYSAPETWVDDLGRWRLKIKRPATRLGLHFDSYRERFSCREVNPASNDLEYYNPILMMFGPRGALGHLPLDIDQPTPRT